MSEVVDGLDQTGAQQRRRLPAQGFPGEGFRPALFGIVRRQRAKTISDRDPVISTISQASSSMLNSSGDCQVHRPGKASGVSMVRIMASIRSST